jgi:hypothetical protein
MKGRGLLVGLAMAGLLVTAGSSSAARSAATFTDPPGDQQGTAPDVTTTAVSHDSSGNITFRITVANQPTLAADSQVALWIDTDRNPDTGAPSTRGSEFVFIIAPDGYSFGRWNGTEFVVAPYTTVHVAYASGATITVNRSELANANAFNFWMLGFQETGPDTANVDAAPNDGTYAYVLTTPGPPYGVVGQKSMRKINNGLRATFVFRSTPPPGSRIMVVWYDRGKPFARPTYPLARTISSSALGVSRGVFEAHLRVKPPGKPWKTVAKVKGRR